MFVFVCECVIVFVSDLFSWSVAVGISVYLSLCFCVAFFITIWVLNLSHTLAHTHSDSGLEVWSHTDEDSDL